jgi:hypothetical protein
MNKNRYSIYINQRGKFIGFLETDDGAVAELVKRELEGNGYSVTVQPPLRVC